jgi:hypothetical protein
MDAAKRYRVDTEKLQRAVAKEFAAKRAKKTVKAQACNTVAMQTGAEQVWARRANAPRIDSTCP